MKILLVPWMLLLFGVNLNSGHYIRDLEYGNPDVYKVREGSGVTIVNPKADKPTLREILYYHIIERPRGDPAITERSFTNGHGYQFLEPEPSPEDYDDTEHENYLKEADDIEDFVGKDEDAQMNEEEEAETTTEARPLTDEDVKEAYKARHYLFDQMRQRYAVKRMAEPSLIRRKRQAEMQPLPDAPVTSDNDASGLPKTYGMNLNPEGGYVWNNLNNPQSYYEVGANNGNPNEGQSLYESAQSQENMPPLSENAYIPPENSDSGSSEDIYVNTNRPSAMPLETEPEPVNPEAVNDNPDPKIGNPEANNSEANYPVKPILGNVEAESNEGYVNNPTEPKFGENPEPNYPVDPIVDNPGPIEGANSQDDEVPQAETPISEGPSETVGDLNPGYGQSELEEPKPNISLEENTEGDKIKEIPEAPTLSPLNYDNLPDYIRDAISSTEKPTSYEQTDNPYINPQPSPDDKKAMEGKMEDILATMPPVEDIPKTYGMNLTSDGGHVWNDMVNPPVSYDVGSPSNPQEEHKEEQTQAPIEQPEIHEENPIPEPAEPEKENPGVNSEEPKNPIEEQTQAPAELPEIHEKPENPIPELAEPEKKDPIVNPEEPNQEPETYESEEAKNPEPENQGEPEEPENEGEPQTHQNEDKPIEEPAEPVDPLIPEPAIESENPEVIPEPGNEDNHEAEQSGDIQEPSEDDEDRLGESMNEPVTDIPAENKPDIMNELLKSEQFWNWLGEWTATYMELLEKHMRKIAIQEICKREKTSEQTCPLEDNPEDIGVIVKDGKIIVDGREIEMTHTDNLDSELKGHHNNKHENKGSNGNKIEASTIYGNSVGNEKVTNVFIFTADKAEEVIDNLKPANDSNDSEIDFVIDDRIKEENKGEPNKEKSVEDESNLESNIDDGDKESNDGAVDTKEPNNEEADKEADLGETTAEVIKEELKEGEANKESNVSEGNTEELNNEDVNIESNESVNKEESSKNENSSLKPEINQEDLNKNEEPKGTSGDIGQLDGDTIDESKLDSSEKNTSNSKEYLEEK